MKHYESATGTATPLHRNLTASRQYSTRSRAIVRIACCPDHADQSMRSASGMPHTSCARHGAECAQTAVHHRVRVESGAVIAATSARSSGTAVRK